MSTVVQPCARCGARWAVQSTPLHWCPRCRGVLLSPGPIDAPPQRRNYRWVARKPDHRVRKPGGTGPVAPTPTPRYREIPRWGLHDLPPPAPAAARSRLDDFASNTERLLILTAWLFGLAALAEVLRYLILLRNRTRLIHPFVLTLSDVFVWATGLAAVVFALGTAVALAGWLIRTRRATYARTGHADPRAPYAILLGCLVPVVNLLWPGVYLAELATATGDPRAERAVRIWWCAWVGNGVLVAAALLWRTADSLQAQADGVAFTALTDAVAAAVAVLTLAVVRLFDGRDLRGRARMARRWVVATDPAVPVIEPVHPGGARREAEPAAAAARDADDAGVTEDRVTEDRQIAHGAEDRAQEEVVAK
ncbi:hypothetical protein CJ469_03273 [Nocardia farcinica]|uniref:DUF4328 domain-containing protein n=1 Tax=Nocardia farcinica TaxID=37329 RepID=UPI000BFA4BE9|nr:DUF4328 domain-containing protein [Nocardia farcinica]PFX01955.1 hypothetical protein CJ469_03273 [Nocardia farcinica]PFX08811.1 hypothetical protein CJ468_02055 [Nocardia farcinica]